MSAIVSRRKLIVGAAMLGTASVIGALRSRGYDVPAAKARDLVSLQPWQFVVLTHLARRLAAPDANDGSVPTPDEVGVAEFVDAHIATMRPKMRKDLLGFFGLVEHVLPLSSGYVSRFTQLPADAQDDVLRALEASNRDLLRGAFQGVKSLVFMGYYRDPRTWTVLGYEGPWVAKGRAT
jgi:hypothetical protein